MLRGRASLAGLIVWTTCMWPGMVTAGANSEVVVDARTMTADPNRISVRRGATVGLRLTHPNVFRESYTITAIGVDHYAVKLPEALKGIVGIGELASTQIVKPLGLSTQGLDPVPVAFDVAQGCAVEIDAQLQVLTTEDVVSQLSNRLVSADDDADARFRTLEFLKATAIRTRLGDGARFGSERADSSDLPQDSRRKALLGLDELLSAFDKRSAEWSDRWKNARAAWTEAYERWKQDHAKETGNPDAAKYAKMDAALASDDEWMKKLPDRISEARKRLEGVVELAMVALDPIRCPAEINRSVEASQEEIEVTITATPRTSANPGAFDVPIGARSAVAHIRSAGRFTVDFSLGLAGTNLGKRSYFLALDPDTVALRPIVREGTREPQTFAPAAFVQVVWTQMTSGFRWAPILPAVGLTTSSTPQYMLGGGVQFGGRSRVNIMGGIAWGQVSVPSGPGLNEHLPKGSTQPPLADHYHRGRWFAVTFMRTLPGGSGDSAK